MHVGEEKRKGGRTDMVLGGWVCMGSPGCFQLYVSELCSKTVAFPHALFPQYHQEHVGMSLMGSKTLCGQSSLLTQLYTTQALSTGPCTPSEPSDRWEP